MVLLFLCPLRLFAKITFRADLHSHFAGAISSGKLLSIASSEHSPYPISLLRALDINFALLTVLDDKNVALELEKLSEVDRSKLTSALTMRNEHGNFHQLETAYEFRRPIAKNLNLFPKILREIAIEYRASGVSYAELSLGNTESSEWSEAIRKNVPIVALETGVNLRFLAALWRHNTLDENKRILKANFELSNPFVAGLDLMGEETNSLIIQKPIFDMAKKYRESHPNYVIRIHAGESKTQLDNLKLAIAFGATRVAHGVHGLDAETLTLALKNQVVVEISPTSNIKLSNIDTVREIPIEDYIAAGVKIVVGTDSPGIFVTSLDAEIQRLRDIGINEKDLEKISLKLDQYVSKMTHAPQNFCRDAFQSAL